MTLNDCKCELISDDEEVINYVRQLIPAVSTIDPSEAVVLGAPVGGGQVIDSVLQQKLVDLQRLADRLKLLSTHDGFFLLKNCFSLPKLMYTLRSAPCYDSPFIRQYDNLIRNTLQSILNVTLSDDAWSQSKLPVKLGGLGVLSASDIAIFLLLLHQ